MGKIILFCVCYIILICFLFYLLFKSIRENKKQGKELLEKAKNVNSIEECEKLFEDLKKFSQLNFKNILTREIFEIHGVLIAKHTTLTLEKKNGK